VGIVELWVMTEPFKTVLSHISTPTRKTCNSHIMHNIGNVDKKHTMQLLFLQLLYISTVVIFSCDFCNCYYSNTH